jgi:hypothetical protein
MLFRDLPTGAYFEHLTTGTFEPRRKVSIHKKMDVDPKTGQTVGRARTVRGDSQVRPLTYIDGRWGGSQHRTK